MTLHAACKIVRTNDVLGHGGSCCDRALESWLDATWQPAHELARRCTDCLQQIAHNKGILFYFFPESLPAPTHPLIVQLCTSCRCDPAYLHPPNTAQTGSGSY